VKTVEDGTWIPPAPKRQFSTAIERTRGFYQFGPNDIGGEISIANPPIDQAAAGQVASDVLCVFWKGVPAANKRDHGSRTGLNDRGDGIIAETDDCLASVSQRPSDGCAFLREPIFTVHDMVLGADRIRRPTASARGKNGTA
jgi:hypothetical protein